MVTYPIFPLSKKSFSLFTGVAPSFFRPTSGREPLSKCVTYAWSLILREYQETYFIFLDESYFNLILTRQRWNKIRMKIRL